MNADGEFDEFVAFHRGVLMAQAMVLAGSAPAAEDLVQETLIRAWLHWRRVSTLDNPAAWARRILYNLAVSEWRRERVRRRHHEARPVSQPPGVEEGIALAQALRQLPVSQRQALVMHHAAGMPVTEIAAEMGAPEGTVRSWLSRGRATLADLLEIPAQPRSGSSHG